MIKEICNRLKLAITEWQIYLFNKKNGVELISDEEYIRMLAEGKITKRIYLK